MAAMKSPQFVRAAHKLGLWQRQGNPLLLIYRFIIQMGPIDAPPPPVIGRGV